MDVSDTALPDNSLRQRFETLMENTFADHLGVADYARLLQVSPTHFSRVMRQTTGPPPCRRSPPG